MAAGVWARNTSAIIHDLTRVEWSPGTSASCLVPSEDLIGLVEFGGLAVVAVGLSRCSPAIFRHKHFPLTLALEASSSGESTWRSGAPDS